MITLIAPYQFNVPKAPDDLYLQKLDDYHITYVQDYESDEEEPIELVETVEIDNRFKSRQNEDDLDIFAKIQMISERA